MSNESLDPIGIQEVENNSHLKEIVYKYLAYWKWFVASFVLSLSIAFIFLKYHVPVYNIQASILIKDEQKGMGQDVILKELDIFSSNKVVDNEIEILRSYTLMEKVVKSLNLNICYYRVKKFKDAELYDKSPIRIEMLETNALAYRTLLHLQLVDNQKIKLNGTIIPLNKETSTPYGLMKISLTGERPDITDLTVSVQPAANVIENFISKLKIKSSSKMSSVLLLSLDDAMQQRGEDVLNKLIEVYNADALADKNKVTSNTLVFIEDRLKLIASDLNVLEKNVEDYKSSQGITDISVESAMFLKNVQDNDLELSKVKIQQSVLNNIESYVRKKENLPGTVPATLGVEDPTLLALIDRLSELEGQRERTIKLSKEDNPLILAIDEQIKGVRKGLLENIQNLRENLNLTRLQLENQISGMEAEIKTVPGKERNLVDITRQQSIKNNLYIFLLQKREETAVSFASAVSDSRTIDIARSSSEPVNPIGNVYLIFAFLGIVVPFLIIYFLDLLNDKINSRRDIEKGTKAPVFGEISYVDHKEALVISDKGRSTIAEQIRALRTNLAFLSPNKTVQCILLTSSISKEGKSFVSLNLGASLAMTDNKTVILELDMRNPKLHGALNIPNTVGISNYLIGKAELKDMIRPIPGHPNYYIITCGPIPPNPVELLITSRLEELFTELRKQFNYIIIDSPPLGLVTDAQILEKQADATIYMLRYGYTPKNCLEFINALYKEKKFKNLNLVFNAIKEGGIYGYGYGYRYGYGYGYGYHQEQAKPLGLFKRLLLAWKKR